MLGCWDQNPAQRPLFAEIVQDLDRIVALSSHDVSDTHDVFCKENLYSNYVGIMTTAVLFRDSIYL